MRFWRRDDAAKLRGVKPRVLGAWEEARALARYAANPKRSCETKFVILGGSGRTGSTLLVKLLDSLEGVTCHDELLCWPLLSPFSFVRHHSDICETPAFGFKLLPYHLNLVQNVGEPINFLDRLKDDGYRFIHLYRENVLSQILSDLHARDSREWHADQPYTVNGIGPRRFEMREILWRLDHFDEGKSFVDAFVAREPALELIYERDLQNQEAHEPTVRRVAEYLGVPFSKPYASEKKRLPIAMNQIIENYDELVATLEGTPYERYLH